MRFYLALLIASAVVAAHSCFHSVGHPLIVAHRGASHDAPENTLAAFRLAWEQGADAIEGDFYLTQDGQIVCIHDDTTKRTAEVDLTIADATLDQLRQLDVGSWKEKKWAGERIPTVEQVLEIVPQGKKIYFEVKCGPEIVAKLKRALAESGLKDEQVVVISFRDSVILEVERTMPQLKTLWLVAYHKNDETGRWGPTIDEIIRKLQSCKADGLGTEANSDVVDGDFVRKLRDEKFEFHTWTVDKPETARHFASLGVDAIITNRPAFLRSQLQSGSSGQ
jgi:glycerophosphoryl diester phosphodiesterase